MTAHESARLSRHTRAETRAQRKQSREAWEGGGSYISSNSAPWWATHHPQWMIAFVTSTGRCGGGGGPMSRAFFSASRGALFDRRRSLASLEDARGICGR